jgi:hypothetical protein
MGLFDDIVDIQANVRGIDDWPGQERFPYNFKRNKVEVEQGQMCRTKRIELTFQVECLECSYHEMIT